MNPRVHKPLRAAIYVRVSSDDQKKGYGPALQLEQTMKVAVENDRCIVRPEHVIDDSVSGSHDNRPGWKKLLEIARRGEIDSVYFWKLDRMMRDEYYFYVNERELKELHVELRFATQNLDDPFNRAIQVAVAAEERRKILERTYGGRVRALRDGKWVGPTPYGYALDKKTGRLRMHSKEAKWVQTLFRWFVADEMSLTGLGIRARANHIPTRFDQRHKKKPRYGYAFWSKGSLGRLLGREYYASGVAWFHKYRDTDRRYDKRDLRPKEEWIPVPVPKLISKDQFDKAQKQLRRNRAYAWGAPKYSYLFARRLRCGTCNLKLTACCRPERKHDKYYRGESWRDQRCIACRHYLEHTLDTSIWAGLMQFFQNPKAFLSALDSYRSRQSKLGELTTDQQALAELEVRLNDMEKRLIDLQLEGFYSRPLLEEKRRQLQSERAALEERRVELQRRTLIEQNRVASAASAEQLYEKIRSKVENPTYAVKQLVYSALLDEIVLYGQRAEVWISVPQDIDLVDLPSPSGGALVAVQRCRTQRMNRDNAGHHLPDDSRQNRHCRSQRMNRDSAGTSRYLPIAFPVDLPDRHGHRIVVGQMKTGQSWTHENQPLGQAP